MSEKDALQKAADEARKVARAAREFGGLLDDYAKYLMQSNFRGRADEAYLSALNKLSVINDGLAACNKWVVEGDKIAAAPTPGRISADEVSKTRDTIEFSKPRAFRVTKKESQG